MKLFFRLIISVVFVHCIDGAEISWTSDVYEEYKLNNNSNSVYRIPPTTQAAATLITPRIDYRTTTPRSLIQGFRTETLQWQTGPSTPATYLTRFYPTAVTPRPTTTKNSVNPTAKITQQPGRPSIINSSYNGYYITSRTKPTAPFAINRTQPTQSSHSTMPSIYPQPGVQIVISTVQTPKAMTSTTPYPSFSTPPLIHGHDSLPKPSQSTINQTLFPPPLPPIAISVTTPKVLTSNYQIHNHTNTYKPTTHKTTAPNIAPKPAEYRRINSHHWKVLPKQTKQKIPEKSNEIISYQSKFARGPYEVVVPQYIPHHSCE